MGQPAVTEENQAPPDHFQTDLPVGEILRRTRVHYSQSLLDIERSLRIRASQLEALETGDYGKLPGKVYVIGFIRSYSEYLGLDGEKMVALYKTQSGTKTGPQKVVHSPVMASDMKMPQGWQVGVSVIAVLVIAILWFSMQKEDRSLVTDVPTVAEATPETPAPDGAADAVPPEVAALEQSDIPQPAPVENTADAADSMTQDEATAATSNEIATITGGTTASAPAEEAPPAESAAPAKADTKSGVILNMKENSWVEIRGKDGKALVSRVLNAGDRYYVPDRPDLTISLGNSGGVELEVQGQKLKKLGAVGEVKRNIPLDAAYLKKNFGS